MPDPTNEPPNREGCWREAVAALDRISPETVNAIRTGRGAVIRCLTDHQIRQVCAFAITAIGEATYLRAEAARTAHERN